MAITIRAADPESDRDVLIETLSRYLPRRTDNLVFDWLYRANPDGPARAWIALNKANGAMVGAAAAFPRQMHVSQRVEMGWVLGDFCIAPAYRSLGPARALQRMCLGAADTGSISFWYDFPSPGMMAVYEGLGVRSSRQMRRFAKLLRLDGKIRAIVRTPVIARAISASAAFLFPLATRGIGDPVIISRHEGTCGEEFSDLARQIGGRYGVCVRRSAEYLNWRYVANPLYHYELLTARHAGALTGYAVLTYNAQTATLVDLFSIDAPRVIASLIEAAADLMRERGLLTLSAPFLEPHPWAPLLRRLGFVKREACPVVVYASARSGVPPADGLSWFLTHGDRDS